VAPPRVAVPEDPGAVATPPPSASGAVTVRVRLTDDGGTRVVTMPLDQYVVGAVRAELSPRALQNDVLYRLLQVQAIVSRTYALANIRRHNAEDFDLCDSTHCQLYRGKLASESDADLAARAVAATQGQVITFGGRVIQALFHSSCGGHTTSASAVWGGDDMPYLRPVPDWFCTRPASATNWEFAVDEPGLRRALNSDVKTTVGSRLARIDVTQRDESGRAELLTLQGTRAPVVRAEEFRAVLRRVFGQRAFRSTWFTVARRGDQFVFTGVGFGHGVGLCQTGASQRAQAGQMPSDIVSHYYPGTRLQAASLALVGPAPVTLDRHVGHE
jgi:stage II sporulation protein D